MKRVQKKLIIEIIEACLNLQIQLRELLWIRQRNKRMSVVTVKIVIADHTTLSPGLGMVECVSTKGSRQQVHLQTVHGQKVHRQKVHRQNVYDKSSPTKGSPTKDSPTKSSQTKR